jgi:hypothetical protein
VDQLCHHQVRDVVVDLLADEHDALVEQARVDVEGTLAAGRLLQDHGNERGLGAADLHGGSFR